MRRLDEQTLALADVPFKALYRKELYDARTRDGWVMQITRYKLLHQSGEQTILNEPLRLVTAWPQHRPPRRLVRSRRAGSAHRRGLHGGESARGRPPRGCPDAAAPALPRPGSEPDRPRRPWTEGPALPPHPGRRRAAPARPRRHSGELA